MPGVPPGFDPISGDLLWAWDMGREDRTGLPPEGDTYTRGTPNVWSLTSADDELGLIYLPTGNATPDYWGGHRTEAMERYDDDHEEALQGDLHGEFCVVSCVWVWCWTHSTRG
mgnify:CR=1 FL=1